MTATLDAPRVVSSFAEFEALVGADVAEDVLQRLCEECWGPDSQYGVRVSDVTSLDTLGDNHEATGSVEHDHVWYGFGIKYGTAYGTHIDYFELEEEAPPELLDARHPALVLQACLNAHIATSEHLKLARGRSLARLHALNPRGGFSRQPRLTHDLLGGVLGDIAVQHQDFVDDALPVVRFAFTSQQNLRDLFSALSEPLREALAHQARALHADCSAQTLLATGLGYLPSTMLEPIRT